MARNICPSTRARCNSVEICWLIFCARSRLAGGVRLRPIDERELTKAERYVLHMAEQRKHAASEKRSNA